MVRTVAASEHLFRLTDLRRRASKVASEMLAAALRGSEPGDGAFAPNVVLEVRSGAEQGAVFGQRAQRYTALTQRFGRVEQMLQAPSEPIESPDDKYIARSNIRNPALEPGRARNAPEAASS